MLASHRLVPILTRARLEGAGCTGTPAKAGAGVFGISRPLCGDNVKPQRYQLN
jgi:hypothetical protein